MVSIALPMEVFNEQHAINRVAMHISLIRPKMRAEFLTELLRDALRRGDSNVTEAAIEAAEHKNDALADSVLRSTWFEMRTHHELIPKQLDAFGDRAVKRAPVERGAGRFVWSDLYCRNFGLCVLVPLEAAEFGINCTRNRETRRADRVPSAISLICAAAKRHGIDLDERSFQDDIWFKLPGALVRMAYARHLLGQFSVPDQIS